MNMETPDLQAAAAAYTDAADPAHSSLREKMLETIFLAELTKVLWKQGRRDFEILRAEVDRGGYDLAVDCAGIVRHIQLKSKHRDGKAADVPVSLALASKPSGCVIWMSYDPASMQIGPFLWFGAAPGKPLPDLGAKVARHTRGNKDGVKAERPGHRVLSIGHFKVLTSMADVAGALFGTANGTSAADRLADLAAFAPRLRKAVKPAQTSEGSPVGGRWTFHKADEPLALPHFEHDNLLSGFIDMAYASGWVSPEVDWMRWTASAEARQLRADPARVADADEAMLEKLMTTLVRAERFGEGELAEALRSGLLLRIAERAGAIMRTT